VTSPAPTQTNEELPDAARNGDEGARAALVERHRDRLKRMARLRRERRPQGRVDPADVIQDAYLAVRGKFPRSSADPRLPLFRWGSSRRRRSTAMLEPWRDSKTSSRECRGGIEDIRG
jgi:DNA-directed RNA polymerase specialized sigma24 family protein